LERGKHVIQFEATDLNDNKKQSFYITVAVYSPDTLKQYQKLHQAGLADCADQKMPLALQTDRSLGTSEQSIYDYPNLRLP
jgi:hypothetical protein